jgi:hypothetical protein
MARPTTARWTLPLTALLFVNTVLVALAARQVGLIPEPTAAMAEGSVVIAEALTPDEASAATEPRLVTSAAPPNDEAGSADVGTTQGAEWTFGEFALTIDTPGTAVANAGDVPSEPTRQPSAAGPADAIPAPGASQEDQPPCQHEFLTFVNPPAAGGVVHFVIDGEVISLAPGELYRLPVADERLVEFHRGDAFGDAEHCCQFGAYVFAVGDTGWTLGEVGGSLAARLLKICRPIAARTEANSD